MKILVTGVAGFIGSATASLLLDMGAEVVGIDNLSAGSLKNVPEGVEFYEMNVSNSSISSLLTGVHACIHFAAFINSSESQKYPNSYYRNNIGETLILFDSLERANVNKIVFSSSAAVYGDASSQKISEKTATNPTSVYGETKLYIDNILDSLAKIKTFRSVSLRYFNAAGSYKNLPEEHRNESHLIPLAVDAALGMRSELPLYGNNYTTPDGTCIRDYVHVEDIARAHIMAIEYLNENFRLTANLGTGKGFSNLEIIKAVERCVGKKVPYYVAERREGDPAVLVAENFVAEQKLKWTPKKSLLDAVSDCVKSKLH